MNFRKTCKVFFLSLFFGISIALFGLTSSGIYLEEQFGLSWLFKLRGSIEPSDKVVIISIDKISADILQMPHDPEKWPRSIYTHLIKKINLQSPAIIGLNMMFGESRGLNNDKALAEEMALGQNIVLSNYLKQGVVYHDNFDHQFWSEQIIRPVPELENAAIGSAPFLLPKTSTTIKQFWTYKNSSGEDLTTFPVAIIQSFVFKNVYPEIRQLLEAINPFNIENIPESTHEFFQHSMRLNLIKLVQAMVLSDQQNVFKLKRLIDKSLYSEEKKHWLKVWLSMMDSPKSLYLNYYGGAGSIPTIPFYQALVSDILNPALFTNKIVLIGYSETIEPEKNQGFYTVFSESNMQTISPIEIAATAVNNLIEQDWIKPLTVNNYLLLLLCWGCLIAGISFLPYQKFILFIISLTCCYLAVSFYLFSNYYIWIPIISPLLIVVPLVTLFKSLHFFRKGKQQQEKIEKAFSLYVPNKVVSSFKQHNDLTDIYQYGELSKGVCMATDAEQYTILSEKLSPQALSQLINTYYEFIFSIVSQHQGIISDVIGDAMFAVWPISNDSKTVKNKACLAASEIMSAVNRFNDKHEHPLPTRMGLHFGEFRLGNVGSAHHYEYRAVGDTVNTTTLLEGLNKLLGTRVLATKEVVDQVVGIKTREMGYFLLKGKKQPIHVYELMTETELIGQNQPIDFSLYLNALNDFKRKQWDMALEKWEKFQTIHPEDGPTRFYIIYLKSRLYLFSKDTHVDQPTLVNVDNRLTFLAFQNKTSIEFNKDKSLN